MHQNLRDLRETLWTKLIVSLTGLVVCALLGLASAYKVTYETAQKLKHSRSSMDGRY